MHSVVNTIVKPLTDARRSSFVCLWGGRKVDYFVPLAFSLLGGFPCAYLTGLIGKPTVCASFNVS